ncbi:MAG: DUF4270 domain-containing protein [Flavobacteriaceae bacterium]|nr:DUF4270 domain-containing protein [Flavobacteriaceae bacterium]
MKITNLIPKFGILFILVLAIASCEEDFSNLDTGIIDENFTRPDTTFSVVAYSRFLKEYQMEQIGVQTNGLSSYKLGVYVDPVYGKTTTNFLGQLALNTPNPTFPVDSLVPILEKVTLYIPYYSDATQGSNGVTTYTLDSIYGNTPIDISIYESNYFLRDIDPESNFEEPQKYYSNQGALFESNLGALITTEVGFTPSKNEIEFILQGLDTLSFAPGLFVELPVEYFQQKIIDREGEEVLLNNNNFKNYFRGLYLKASSGEDGNMFLFNTDDAKVSLYYSSRKTKFVEGEGYVYEYNANGSIVREYETLDLNFSGININVYDSPNNPSPEIAATLQNPNVSQGEERLFLSGSKEIITIIDLFDGDDNQNGINDLQELREKKWLINEANLIFYVDQDMVTGGSKEPERIMIFDTKNNNILADYAIDLTTNNSGVNAVTQHLGRLERNSDNLGEYYKIRLTAHLSNLINRDSTNVSLGLMVSQNVSQVSFGSLEKEIPVSHPSQSKLTKVPTSCIISHEGTVLHGNRSSNQEKRLKLQVYYTEPNN